MEYITKSAGETQDFGFSLANNLKSGGVWALVGDLGSGKTTFVQGFANGLGVSGRVISPTFILVRKYKLMQSPNLEYLYHIDMYRLETDIDTEIHNLGLDEVWKDQRNLVLIEWADKIKKLPENTKWIYFDSMGENVRKITLD